MRRHLGYPVIASTSRSGLCAGLHDRLDDEESSGVMVRHSSSFGGKDAIEIVISECRKKLLSLFADPGYLIETEFSRVTFRCERFRILEHIPEGRFAIFGSQFCGRTQCIASRTTRIPPCAEPTRRLNAPPAPPDALFPLTTLLPLTR